jgi:hypothetical protein
LWAGCEVDHSSRRAKHVDNPRNGNPAATRSQHHSPAGVTHLFREPALERAEIGLATVGKDAADRLPFTPLDLLIEVDEWSRETRGKPPSDGSLAGARKPDQNNVRSCRQPDRQLPFAAPKREAMRAT